MNIAMILAGGTGSRLGADIPKQFLQVRGKPVLVYTIENFQNNTNIDAILVVSHPDWLNECKELASVYALDKIKWFTTGGDTFQTSVLNGVNYLRDRISREDTVLVSFGVSPYTTDEIINDSIRVCEKYGLSFDESAKAPVIDEAFVTKARLTARRSMYIKKPVYYDTVKSCIFSGYPMMELL